MAVIKVLVLVSPYGTVTSAVDQGLNGPAQARVTAAVASGSIESQCGKASTRQRSPSGDAQK